MCVYMHVCVYVFMCVCVSVDVVADPDFCGHWILREWPCALRVSSLNVELSCLVLVCPLKILLHIHCFRSAGMPVIWSPRGNPSAGLSYSGGGSVFNAGRVPPEQEWMGGTGNKPCRQEKPVYLHTPERPSVFRDSGTVGSTFQEGERGSPGQVAFS